MDILIFPHRCADIDGVVLCQQQLVGVTDQRIAAAAGNGIEPFIHATVDIDDTAVCLDGGLPGLYRHMPGDDLAVYRVGTEFGKNTDGGFLLLDPLIVGVLFLFAGGIIGDEITLEGGNFILAA